MIVNIKQISAEKITDGYALIRYEKNDECYSCIIDEEGNELYNVPFREESEMIEKFGSVQDGEHHPENFLLKQNFYNAVCRLLDYSTYYVTTMDTNDRLNETLQFFEYGYCVSDEMDGCRNEDIEKVQKSLEESEKMLALIVKETKNRCKAVFEEVFSRDEETQKLILGELYIYDENELDEFLDYEICREHPYYSEEAFADFMEEFANTFI